jgi:hypothetical protein
MDDIYKLIEDLSKKIDKLVAQSTPPVQSNAKLYEALAQAQSEMLDIQFTGENCYYKDRYATLGDLIRMSRPALTKYGLCVFQDIRKIDDIDVLRTTLAHTSGQSISTEVPIRPSKNTLNVIGSYIAYMRRISMASLLGICVHDSDDDDGYHAGEDILKKVIEGKAPENTSKDTHTQEYKRLSKAEVAELEKAMGTHYDLGQDILSKYGVDSLHDLPSSKYTFLLSQLRKNVAYREGGLV